MSTQPSNKQAHSTHSSRMTSPQGNASLEPVPMSNQVARRWFLRNVSASAVALRCVGLHGAGIASACALTPTSSYATGNAASLVDDYAVDAHVHVWTPDTKKYPLAQSFAKAEMAPASFTPEQLFSHSRPNGVARIVLIQMNFYEFDNSYMLDSIEKNPGVFSGVAIIDETRADAPEKMKSLYAKGVRGFRLYADKEKTSEWSRSTGMKAMWSRAADLGQSICLLANPDALPSIHEMCGRYPKTRVVIDHFARIGVTGEVNQERLDQLCRLADYENVYVKTSAFYALGKKKSPYTDLAPMIERLVKVYGAKRLMWASDCPFQVVDGHNYADSIALVREKLSFLSDEDKRWMLRGTAEQVYYQGLPAVVATK